MSDGPKDGVTLERQRVEGPEASHWRFLGPYVSERQWGTVREDYSSDGNAWAYFPFDHASSRAYRWGEDGLAGLCDVQQRFVLSLALWNGADPILKERLFGLTNPEGNHGEDCKELYAYLDAVPSGAWLRWAYKYPQRAFPYAELRAENGRRGPNDPEYEIWDTDAFAEDRYFDVEVTYAKRAPYDLLMAVTATNRGDQESVLHILPQLWFRNTWSWREGQPKPTLEIVAEDTVEARHPELGVWRIRVEGPCEPWLCENETNVTERYGVDAPGPFKDGIEDRLVHGVVGAAPSAGRGTKAALHTRFVIPAGATVRLRVRLWQVDGFERDFNDFDATLALREADADAFYADIQREVKDPEARKIQRQAWSSMLWSKQFYYLDVPEWLAGDPGQPKPPPGRSRNREWAHLNNADILSMPDKWEYPWYAAWDLAFHCIPLTEVDPEFAKEQLVLLTREWYMHPNGQLPAYEWAFGDVNPPVHAWATWRVFEIDRQRRGDAGDLAFLERVFHKLMLNFTWWVNRKDEDGRNIFQGGFLGLDNIGVFDRSAPLPTGGHIDQADGTSWMAAYALHLMRIALELARHNHVYEDIATKYFEHFLHIAEAMNHIGGGEIGLWDEEDQFFYDVLHTPGGQVVPLRLRTMVGLLPLAAVVVVEQSLLDELPGFTERLEWYLRYRPELSSLVSRWNEAGSDGRRLFSLLRAHRMKAVLTRMLDEQEFLSDYGIRALSKVYRDQPYEIRAAGRTYTVRYTPGESDTNLFGGNSNWRGPIWFPVNYLLVDALREFDRFYGARLTVEHPTGSGREFALGAVADEISNRLTSLFRADAHGQRPMYRGMALLEGHPGFREWPLFFEYFHGDTGRGVGASHQTGWTGLVASLFAKR